MIRLIAADHTVRRRTAWFGCVSLLLALVAFPLASFPLYAQEHPFPSTVADQAKLVEVYGDPRFFEGPVWDGVTGKLYFTAFGKEKADTQILRLDEPGKVTVWADKTEGINGMAMGNDGRLIGAQAFGHRILASEIGPNGPINTQVLVYDTKLHQPNDVAQAPNGDIYYTDPDFDKQSTSAVYVLVAGKQPRKIIEDMKVPNGIKVSNNGQWLYVADDGPKNWRAYPIRSDGSVGPGQLFFDPPVAADKKTDPDGFTIDERNNLYLSGSGGVWVVDSNGKSLGLIPIPEFCSNVAFGGADGKTLYMTCSTKVYSLKMKARGAQFTRTNKAREIPKAATPEFVLTENVEYGTGGGEKLTLHLATPTKGSGPFPVVVFIHGGGWSGGKKDDHKAQAIEAAKRGYVSVSVGYRLAPKHRFPACVEDVKCAIRYLRAHAKDLNINPKKIGAVGFSAGAHLAMMLGTMDPGDGLEGEGGWADQPSKVEAVVNFVGPTDLGAPLPEVSVPIVHNFIGGPKESFAEAYKKASPITYVNEGDAPMLLMYGMHDPLIPNDQGFRMAEALAKAKIVGRMEMVLEGSHGWAGKPMEDSFRSMWEFLERNLKGK